MASALTDEGNDIGEHVDGEVLGGTANPKMTTRFFEICPGRPPSHERHPAEHHVRGNGNALRTPSPGNTDAQWYGSLTLGTRA